MRKSRSSDINHMSNCLSSILYLYIYMTLTLIVAPSSPCLPRNCRRQKVPAHAVGAFARRMAHRLRPFHRWSLNNIAVRQWHWIRGRSQRRRPRSEKHKTLSTSNDDTSSARARRAVFADSGDSAGACPELRAAARPVRRADGDLRRDGFVFHFFFSLATIPHADCKRRLLEFAMCSICGE